jgi:hypothetical protein
MKELQVVLDFTCLACGQPVSATVECRGAQLALRSPGTVAAVRLPCPDCGAVSKICFETSDGTVRAVEPHPEANRIPSPSVN